MRLFGFKYRYRQIPTKTDTQTSTLTGKDFFYAGKNILKWSRPSLFPVCREDPITPVSWRALEEGRARLPFLICPPWVVFLFRWDESGGLVLPNLFSPSSPVVPEGICPGSGLIQFVGLKTKNTQIRTERDRRSLSLTGKSSWGTVGDTFNLSQILSVDFVTVRWL